MTVIMESLAEAKTTTTNIILIHFERIEAMIMYYTYNIRSYILYIVAKDKEMNLKIL